ncbi:MAG: class I SAM-dependent methyltransferase, partial [Ferruginibacter sp.]|nr:class I SAM-dependent methyltransferase [Ferruginibacter sp.]
MIDLVERSYKQEILDGNDIPFADIRQNMRELNTINTHLGGHAITIAGVKKILSQFSVNSPITICEIGCGGGDNLQAISQWCSKKNTPATFIGIDIKQECIDYAQQQYPLLNCQWLLSDYKELSFLADEQPAIIFSSLFCHHFNEQQLVIMLKWMEQNASKGFFINDL